MISNCDEARRNGGPAFPSGYNVPEYLGMTLRDYFAAKAMQGIVSNSNTKKIEKPELSLYASFSYAMADAMMEARK